MHLAFPSRNPSGAGHPVSLGRVLREHTGKFFSNLLDTVGSSWVPHLAIPISSLSI